MSRIASIQQLRESRYELQAPFRITLAGQPFQCLKVLRHIPKKRLTLHGRWQGSEVIAKLFFDNSRHRYHHQRDIEGATLIARAGIRTAEMMYSEENVRDNFSMIFYRYIQASNTLKSHLDVEPMHLIMEATRIVHQLHQYNLLHQDLHLDNFLVARDDLYLIDGDAIQHMERPLSLDEKLDNLALFLCQLPETMDQDPFIHEYATLSQWDIKPGFIESLRQRFHQVKQHRFIKYAKKSFRSCTEFIKKQNFFKREIWDRQFIDTVNWKQPSPRIIKDGNTCTVYSHNSWVIKRYNIKNIWHGVKRAVQPTRAANSWKFSQIFKMLGINCAYPIALYEERFGPLRQRSYFIAKKIEGITLDKQEVISEDLANKVAALFLQLYNNKISHGDLKASNIIISDSRAYLLDLDSVKLHKSYGSLDKHWRKHIKRFLQNWQHAPQTQQLFQQTLNDKGLVL